jgi:hypothetical protein
MVNVIVTYDSYTGQRVKYIRKVCKCGHSITFLTQHSTICRNCGRTVYPTKECEFKEKMKIKLRKELKNE